MIRQIYHILFAGLLLFSVSNNLKAQEVNASIDTTHYLIGDWIPLELKVITSKEADITWPIIDVNIEELEVLERTGIDSIISKENKTYTQTLTLTVFDSGYYPIPAFDFIIDGETYSSEPKLIIVSSVPLDTTSQEVKGIKQVLTAPLTFMDIFWPFGVIALLGLILLAVLLYFIFREKPEKPIFKAPEIIIPAHEWAFGELTKLKSEDIWQSGNIKLYYSQLSNILRQYIELRFKQPALESTTHEIMDRLKLLKLDQQLLEKTQSTLSLSDFVKFAKAKPLANEHEESYETVYNFVDVTKIVEIKEPKGL